MSNGGSPRRIGSRSATNSTTAAEWPAPAAMAPTRMPEASSVGIGVGLERAVVVPSPSCPSPFQPQENAMPSVVTARQCAPPQVTR
eukprot:scaffold21265_cov131-Isochrysis_galbana.AAC.1